MSLFLALKEKITSKLFIQEIVELKTLVFLIISNAPTEVALAFIFGQPFFGLVIIKFLNPKFLMI